MTPSALARYHPDLPGLAEAVAACPVAERHAQLQERLRRFDGLAEVRLVKSAGNLWRSRRKVIAADGSVVHDDHEVWLGLQLAADEGDATATHRRLSEANLRLATCELTTLSLVQDNGGAPADFLQMEVIVEDEWIDRRLMAPSWRDPVDLRDLIDESAGEELIGAARERLRPSTYRLEKAVDMAAFVDELDAVEAARRARSRHRRFPVTDVRTGVVEMLTQDDLSQDWDRYPSSAQRLFNDWQLSSAGRSGARWCAHWVAQTNDHSDPASGRSLTLIPSWTFGPQLAEVEGRKGSVYELYGKLQKLDARVKVPFGWYFFMLHGNRVDRLAAERVLEGAEAGLIVLAEHDYRILKAWCDQPYGF